MCRMNTHTPYTLLIYTFLCRIYNHTLLILHMYNLHSYTFHIHTYVKSILIHFSYTCPSHSFICRTYTHTIYRSVCLQIDCSLLNNCESILLVQSPNVDWSIILFIELSQLQLFLIKLLYIIIII